MAKVLQHRRGTTAEHANFTGAAGEVTVDTTDKRLVVHDGSTKGGVPAAKKSEIVDAKSELQQAINGLAEEVGTAQEGLQQAIEQEKLDIRALIADELKKYLPLTGGTLDGSITFTSANALKPTSDESYLAVLGGTEGERGANLQVYGESNPLYPGHFVLSAGGKSARCNLWGKTNGGLEWCGKPVAILNGSHFSQPGYYIVGSLCIQWGVVFCAKDTHVTVNFATPFTSLASITTSEAPTNGQTWNLHVSDLTNSYVTFYSSGTDRYVRFIAVGMA